MKLKKILKMVSGDVALGVAYAGSTLWAYYSIHHAYPNIIDPFWAWAFAVAVFCAPTITSFLVKSFPGPSMGQE